jgi:hypothetical protein
VLQAGIAAIRSSRIAQVASLGAERGGKRQDVFQHFEWMG